MVKLSVKTNLESTISIVDLLKIVYQQNWKRQIMPTIGRKKRTVHAVLRMKTIKCDPVGHKMLANWCTMIFSLFSFMKEINFAAPSRTVTLNKVYCNQYCFRHFQGNNYNFCSEVTVNDEQEESRTDLVPAYRTKVFRKLRLEKVRSKDLTFSSTEWKQLILLFPSQKRSMTPNV